MSGATKNPAPTDKDFGRRLYVSEKVYPEQMRTVTDKAKLDEKPFHLSEFKKPYAVDSYGEMEHFYSWPGGFNPSSDSPVVKPEREEEALYSSKLKWITPPPAVVEAGHIYRMEVAKASRTKYTLRTGRVSKPDVKYLFPWFDIQKKTADAKDMEIKQRFQIRTSMFTILWEGPVGRSVNYVYEWVRTRTERFLYLINSIWDGKDGVTINDEPSVVAELIVGDNAAGTYEVNVTDGRTTLKKKVKLADKFNFFINSYSLASILDGSPVLYTGIAQTESPADEYTFSLTTIRFGDHTERPVATYGFNYSLKRDDGVVCETGSMTYVDNYIEAWPGFWVQVTSPWVVDNMPSLGAHNKEYGVLVYDSGTSYPITKNTGKFVSKLFLNKNLVLEFTFYTELYTEDYTGEQASNSIQYYVDSDNYVLSYRLISYPAVTNSYWIWGKYKGVPFHKEVGFYVTSIIYGTGTPV